MHRIKGKLKREQLIKFPIKNKLQILQPHKKTTLFQAKSPQNSSSKLTRYRTLTKRQDYPRQISMDKNQTKKLSNIPSVLSSRTNQLRQRQLSKQYELRQAYGQNERQSKLSILKQAYNLRKQNQSLKQVQSNSLKKLRFLQQNYSNQKNEYQRQKKRYQGQIDFLQQKLDRCKTQITHLHSFNNYDFNLLIVDSPIIESQDEISSIIKTNTIDRYPNLKNTQKAQIWVSAQQLGKQGD